MGKSLKRALALLLALMICSAAIPTVFAAELSDLNGHWAKDYIQSFVEKGLISGYDDGTFRPDRQITRAEFIYIVNRAYGFNDTVTPGDISSLTDVNATYWYAVPIQIAVAAGYISGYDDNTMRPNDPITRQEAAVVITKLNQLTPDASKAVGFRDSESFEDWSMPYIGAVAEATFMRGDENGNFLPTKDLTRAEAVVLLTKSAEEYISDAPETPSTTDPAITTEPSIVTPKGITIDLPKTTDVAVKSTDYIIRFTTEPKDVTVTAEVEDEDLLSLNAFSSKLTISTGSKAGTARVNLTLSKDGYETTETYIDIHVSDPSAQRNLTSDTNNLDEDSISLFYKDESLDAVTGNMTLPSSGEKGSKISWESSNTDVIEINNNKAIVTRPYYTNGRDTTVVLTATLENNGYTDTKQFYVTVLRADSSDDISVTSEVYSVASDGLNVVISSEKEAVTESMTVKEFIDNLIYHPFAEVKIVSESAGKSVNSIEAFNNADSKGLSAKLNDGDYLIIKSENGKRYAKYIIETTEQCDPVTDFEWSGNGTLSWSRPKTTYGYLIEVYKNDEIVLTEEVRANVTTLNLLADLKEEGVGTYSAKIINKGNNESYANSTAVETEASQRLRQLSVPTDLDWDGTTAVWNAVSNAKRYLVTFYKDSVVETTLTVTTNEVDLSDWLQATGEFKFRVTAVADTSSLYIDSDISESSEVITR